MEMKQSHIENQALFSSMLVFDQNRVVRRRNADGAVSPEPELAPHGARTLPDGSMEFNFYAPDAKSVQVVGNGGSMPKQQVELTNRGDGWFTGVVTNIMSGLHYHEYRVDGVRAINPRVPLSYGCGSFFNVCETADPDLDFYFIKDVPHGTVRMDLYKSEVSGGRYRNCWVYTPPGYETDTDKRYPVLYIQHGGGENEIGWFWMGKLNFILDNMLAAGECVPFIAVANCSDAFAETEEEDVYRNVDFSDVIAEDCIPFIDAKYRTIADRESRAMAGLSMGVVYSYMTVFKYPELFANVGFFSGHVMPKSDGEYFGRTFDYSEIFENTELFNSRLNLMFHTSGEQEGGCEHLREFNNSLREKGMHAAFYSCPGYHEWDVWRRCVREFALRLFKPYQA